MRYPMMPTLLVLLGLSASSLGSAAPATPRLPPADGAEVYRGLCGRCHNPRAPNELLPRSWDIVLSHMQTRAVLTERDLEGLQVWFDQQQSAVLWREDAERLLPDAPLVAEHCARCHEPERVVEAVEAHRDADTWAKTVQRMRTYGLRLSRKLEAQLIETLTVATERPNEEKP